MHKKTTTQENISEILDEIVQDELLEVADKQKLLGMISKKVNELLGSTGNKVLPSFYDITQSVQDQIKLACTDFPYDAEKVFSEFEDFLDSKAYTHIIQNEMLEVEKLFAETEYKGKALNNIRKGCTTLRNLRRELKVLNEFYSLSLELKEARAFADQTYQDLAEAEKLLDVRNHTIEAVLAIHQTEDEDWNRYQTITAAKKVYNLTDEDLLLSFNISRRTLSNLRKRFDVSE